MNTTFLYCITVFIWGTTWYAIKLQTGVVAPELSIAYRFLIASAFLFMYSFVRGLKLTFSIRDHAFIFLQGILLFALAYIFQYYAVQYIASGIMAVVFSTIVGMNIINGRIFLKQEITSDLIFGSAVGFLGIVLVFSKELSFDASSGSYRGFLYTFIAVFFASFGNILSSRNQSNGIPLIQTNAYGMAYGGIVMLLYALIKGTPLQFDLSTHYILSLFYLSLFGSVIAFGSYLTLVARIGPARASYSAVLFPIIALVISTFFENYEWNIIGFTGLVLVLSGNILVLYRKSKVSKSVKKILK